MKKVNDIATDIAKIIGFTVALGYSGAYMCQQLTIVIMSVL